MALTAHETQQLQATVEKRRAALRAEVASLICDLDQAGASRDLSELRSLDAAHGRIAHGSYGTCIECGRDIGFARLQASPAAERCIHCQAHYEKTHASPSGSTL